MLYLLLCLLFSLNLQALVISIDSPTKDRVQEIKIPESKLVMPKNVDYNEQKTIIHTDNKYSVPKRPLSMDLRNQPDPANEKYKFCAFSLCGALLVCAFIVGFVELVTLIPK